MKPRHSTRIRYDIWKPIILYACLFSGCNFNDDTESVYDGDVFQDFAWRTYDKQDDKTAFPAGTPYPNRTNNFPNTRHNEDFTDDDYVNYYSYRANRYGNTRRNYALATYTPFSNQPLKNNDSCHPSIGNIEHNTSQHPDKMSQEDLEAGCQICSEEDAYKEHDAVQCPSCKQFICEPCYKKVKEKASQLSFQDYGNGLGAFPCRTQFKCPFCAHPYD